MSAVLRLRTPEWSWWLRHPQHQGLWVCAYVCTVWDWPGSLALLLLEEPTPQPFASFPRENCLPRQWVWNLRRLCWGLLAKVFCIMACRAREVRNPHDASILGNLDLTLRICVPRKPEPPNSFLFKSICQQQVNFCPNGIHGIQDWPETFSARKFCPWNTSHWEFTDEPRTHRIEVHYLNEFTTTAVWGKGFGEGK